MSALRQALIIGGSRGIGYSVAQRFAKSGYNITIVSKNEDNVNKSVNQLRQWSEQNNNSVVVSGQVCDISRPESIDNFVKSLDQSLGAVEVLVNAAAVNRDKLLMSTTEDVVDDIIETNLKGTIFMCKSVLRRMVRHKKGSIVNIGSVVGLTGNRGQTIYSASKAGLVGFTKSLAKEVAPIGVTVNLIAPGFVKTDMTSNIIINPKPEDLIPMRRMGSPQEIAEAVYFLANASYITGEVLICDGGLHLVL
ncbi:3-oxoacyl-[acyl-carrier-protein] reductase-like [Oppia nitens]|uniref:3-oxoacyl-[acyl-carrier-protein] reductase-like n=1 Tax=Oppia nitens TaxID=1686743 RepID=UPI0023DAF551|nr:3-oxoacyl-[acyl-carrier-protein] reductase-like [Oppia nitens]